MTSNRIALTLLLALALGGCADTHWQRSFYEGARIGADNAARQPGARAVPQTTRLPDHDRYERERQRLQGTETTPRSEAATAAASPAAR